MDFYSVIEKRRTVRDFENVKIEDETIKKIIAAGMKAPTNDHMRDWHFIVITEKAVISKLLECIPKGISDEDMESLIKDWRLDDCIQQDCYRNAVPKQYKMLADASCVVIPLFKQKTNILHPDNLSHLNGLASIWCCIENIFLSATAENLACTLRIPLGNEGDWARKVLQFPEEYCMPCFIGIGKPLPDIKAAKQKPYSLEERIHWNNW